MSGADDFIALLLEEGFNYKQIADAMCDGEYLAKTNLTQDTVEEIYDICNGK